MSTKAITSDQNKFVKLAKALNSRSGRKKNPYCLIEGSKLINEALKNNIEIEFIFIQDQNVLTKLEIIKHNELMILELPEKLMKEISTTETSVDAIAIAKQFHKAEPKQANFILYCEEIQDPGNLGSIIRSAVAAGVDSIYLSPNSADIFNPKVIRSAMGTLFKAHVKKDIKLDDLPDYQILAASSYSQDNYSELKYQDQVVLLVGNEAQGLSQEALDKSNQGVIIPMTNDVESLNVVAATSIILFEIKKNLK